MRDLLKLLIVGILFVISPCVNAQGYRLLVIPDNVVTHNANLDSYIYDGSSEFFADEVITILNGTDLIKSPSVSEVRELCKKNTSLMLATKEFTQKFRTSYNVDYYALKKITTKLNARYVLLLTTYIDAENYILRRTVWDFLNIPGATVVDPAYKISTYAVLVDTQTSRKMWSNTYYKTISTCENRIITRGASPQTEQLQKIKDYSNYICPQIAQGVQTALLPPDALAKESQKVYYDIGNIDNVYTKKYRHLKTETGKVYNKTKTGIKGKIQAFKERRAERRAAKAAKKQAELEAKMLEQEAAKQAELEVKAIPVKPAEEVKNVVQPALKDISNKVKTEVKEVKNAVYQKPVEIQAKPVETVKPVSTIDYYNTGFEIKKTRKNRLYEIYDTDKPILRE